jgi:DNA-binding IclR family transcriptional regulator
VEFQADGKRCKPGLRLFQLGRQAGQVYGFAGTALPVMQRVTRQTEEATLMSVLDGTRHLYVHYVDGPLTVGVCSDPGRHGPLHCTSMGKVLMAFAPELGHATADEEHHAGLRAVAVPILRPDGTVFAALHRRARLPPQHGRPGRPGAAAAVGGGRAGRPAADPLTGAPRPR